MKNAFTNIKSKLKNGIDIDTVVINISSLGVIGLILMFVMGTTGLTGAAAISTALCVFGPGGMIGGVISFGAAVMILQAINKFGFKYLFTLVIEKMIENGTDIETIKHGITNTPISKELKINLNEYIDSL